MVDRAHLARHIQANLPPTDADDLLGKAALAHGEADGTSNQADANDCNGVILDHAGILEFDSPVREGRTIRTHFARVALKPSIFKVVTGYGDSRSTTRIK